MTARPLATALVALVGIARAAGAAPPSEATVFIRVFGAVRAELPGAWKEVVERDDVELATGSGFVVSPSGYILTNHHVVSGEDVTMQRGGRPVRLNLEVKRIDVVFPSTGARLEARVDASDADLDLAVLSVPASDLPFVAMGDSDALEPGQPIQVLGFPFGRAVEVGRPAGGDVAPQPTLTRGSVAALRASDGGEARYVQTDASVHPGSSGGPMVDEDGRAVAVIRMMLGREAGPAFGIPINRAKDFLDRSGLERIFPARRLGLGPMQAFDWKGLRLRLPDGFDDVSRARLRVEGGEPEGVMLRVDRVASPLALAEVEAALTEGKTFGGFAPAERSRSRPVTLSGHPALLGSARGRAPSAPEKGEVDMEYALVDLGKEKIAARYVGPADQVAFNRAVLRGSVETLEADALLSAEIAVAPAESFEPVALPEPEAPTIVMPRKWSHEPTAPVACRALPPPDAALSASPEGDFTVALRAAWWRAAGLAPEAAATACGWTRRSAEPAAYSRRRVVLGVTVGAEGEWIARGDGLLRLEVEAPEAKLPLLRGLFTAWVKAAAAPHSRWGPSEPGR